MINVILLPSCFRILEIISTFSTNSIVEAILDLYNIFIGVFIFIIFVLKRKVLYELRSKLGLIRESGTTTPGSITTSGNDICMNEINNDAVKIERLLTDKFQTNDWNKDINIKWWKITVLCNIIWNWCSNIEHFSMDQESLVRWKIST